MRVSTPYINILIYISIIYIHLIHMHHLVTMHHNQIYFIHISILTKYSDQVQPRSHFYNLSIAHNVHTPPILITESPDWVYLIEGVIWIYIPEVYIPMTCSASILAHWWYYPDMIYHPVGLHLVILSRHDFSSCRPSPVCYAISIIIIKSVQELSWFDKA